MNVILSGCVPQPMAAYLKGLAVLRLVSTQADPDARAAWRNNTLVLESALARDALERFFLESYRPTPIVAPWNKGSGFYAGDRRDGIEKITASTDERFLEYRETISAIVSWSEIPTAEMPVSEILSLAQRAASIAPAKQRADISGQVRQATALCRAVPQDVLQAPLALWEGRKKELSRELLRLLRKLQTIAKRVATDATKEELIRACRNRLCDRAVEWVDAAVVLIANGEARYPPILGTGGNEGRLDYTSTFMSRVSDLLLTGQPQSAALLKNALFGEPTAGLIPAPTGQYDPGRAGGYNQGPGSDKISSVVNPWDFVLAMEGAIAWTAGVGRRQGVGLSRHASSPFTVQARAIGYASAGEDDNSKARAEIWMPLWERPARYEEIRTLLREGRAEIGGKEPSDGIHFAEAAASLGIDRGITAFVRYALLPRRGDNFVALPAGVFPVREYRETDLLQDLDPIFRQLDAVRNPPASLLSQRRALEAAIYEYLLHGGPTYFQQIVAALGRLDRRFRLRPAALRPEWLLAADDGGLEIRIAAALAGIGPAGEVGPLREYLTRDWSGNTLARRLAGVLERRLLDAERLGSRKRPLNSLVRLHPVDVAAFHEGFLDEGRLEDVLFGLTLIRWSDASAVSTKLRELWAQPISDTRIPRTWALLKHLFLPGRMRTTKGEEVELHPEPEIIPLLCAGRTGAACSIAQRRLVSAGLCPTRAAFPDSGDGVRTAAALLIPIHKLYLISNLILREAQHV